MADTYTQLYIQVVFAVKHRKAVIHPSWEVNLYKYITTVVQDKGHKMIAINGMPDHIHLFIGTKPHQSLSDLIKVVKAESSKWINRNKFTPERFYWQSGFGAFSYSKSHISRVARYIENQKVHHLTKSFRQEYVAFLEYYDIPYDLRYIFTDPV